MLGLGRVNDGDGDEWYGLNDFMLALA